jgi:hypothetical protein
MSATVNCSQVAEALNRFQRLLQLANNFQSVDQVLQSVDQVALTPDSCRSTIPLLTLLCPTALRPVFERRTLAAQLRGIAASSLCSTAMMGWQKQRFCAEHL